jgi:hypothetical protein
MWAAIMNILLGLWLMMAPTVFDMNQTTSYNNYITGPLVITFSIISLWEINKKVIRANVLIGIWLLVALFVLGFTKTIAFFSNGACAAFIIVFSSIKRKQSQNFGGGWKSLFQHNPPHMREAEKMANRQ